MFAIIKNFIINIFYKNINYKRLLLCMLISIGITTLIYSYNCFLGINSISDFYVGTSLYQNYNKNIDVFLPYFYSFITLFFYVINWEYLWQLFYPYFERFVNYIDNLKPNKKWVFISIIILLLLNLRPFDSMVPTDNYHFGEKLVGSWLINENSYQLYSTFYPPHGLIDIIPSWIATTVFHDQTVYGVLFGKYLFNYIYKFILSILAFSVLPFFVACIGLSIIFTYKYTFMVPSIYLLTILFLIKNQKLKNNFNLYTIATCVSSYLLYVYSPTFGAPFIIAMIIPFVCRFIEFYKKSAKLKVFAWALCFVIINGLIFLIFKEFFINNFTFILQNFQANLFSFGNEGKWNIYNILSKMLQYILIPLFIFMLIEELKNKDKNYDKIMFLTVLLVFPFFISKYALGRLDGNLMSRTFYTSLNIMVLFLPIIINKIKYKKFYVSYIMFISIFALFAFCNDIICSLHKNFQKTDIIVQKTVYRNGNAAFNEEHLQHLNEIQDLIEANTTKDYTFLDLTNQGSLYYYLNKLPLIPYLAYYNIPSPEQDKFYAKKLEENLPDIVLIKGYNIMHDSIPASLRVNKIYKTLLFSNKYTVINNGNITILKKVNYHIFSDKEIELLENALGYNFLHKLPDVYGKSIKHLKTQLEDLKISYNIDKKGQNYIITFKKPIDGKLLNYLYIKQEKKEVVESIVSVNDTNTIIQIKNREELIPLDIHPCILLNKVQTIKISYSKDINIEELRFYHKKVD